MANGHEQHFCFQLRELAEGKLVLVLEGGFNLDVLTEASDQCARALLGLPIEKVCMCIHMNVL